ncbi:histone RNA hairpin-binding protein-like isoform X2 [Orbicella faveolata]|nr:histone RNA hairpin-binding protein-like isoform X2 [Orbicella faveolata]
MSMSNTQNELNLSKEFPPLGMSSYTPEMTKDWGSIVEEEEEKGRRMQTGAKTNSRFKRRLLLSESQEENSQRSKPSKPVLTDAHKLLQRQKQVDIGKNTLSYGRYITAVSREQRTKEDPNTPDKFQMCSTRSWVGQIKNWRRKLHVWDPPSEGQEDLFSSSSQSSVQSFPCEVKMEVDSNCDADDDMMSTSTPSSVDDLFGDFDLDACLMNDGLPL